MTKGDKFVVLAIVSISIFLFVIVNLTQANTGKNYASIQINGEEVEKIVLGEDGTYQYDSDYGKNTIVSRDGKIYMAEADCPDQTCVHQGSIGDSGEIIICLPNRFVVEIKNDEGNEFDAINY